MTLEDLFSLFFLSELFSNFGRLCLSEAFVSLLFVEVALYPRKTLSHCFFVVVL